MKPSSFSWYTKKNKYASIWDARDSAVYAMLTSTLLQHMLQASWLNITFDNAVANCTAAAHSFPTDPRCRGTHDASPHEQQCMRLKPAACPGKRVKLQEATLMEALTLRIAAAKNRAHNLKTHCK